MTREHQHQEHRDLSPSSSVTVVEPKWTSGLALIIAGIAIGFAFAAWQRQDISDRRWEQSQDTTNSRYEEAQRQLDARWAQRLNESNAQWAQSYKELERENRLLQLKVDDMRVALNAQGISTTKHARSDSP